MHCSFWISSDVCTHSKFNWYLFSLRTFLYNKYAFPFTYIHFVIPFMLQWNPTLWTPLKSRHLNFADTIWSPNDWSYSSNLNFPLKCGHPINPYCRLQLVYRPICATLYESHLIIQSLISCQKMAAPCFAPLPQTSNRNSTEIAECRNVLKYLK